MLIGSSVWLLVGFTVGFRIRVHSALLALLVSLVGLAGGLALGGTGAGETVLWLIAVTILFQAGYAASVIVQASPLGAMFSPPEDEARPAGSFAAKGEPDVAAG